MNINQAETQAVAQSIANGLDNPADCAKSPDSETHQLDDTRTYSMADVRACGGDLEAAIMLGQIRYWWPKRKNHRGVKKSYADWKTELGISKEKVQRINDVLVKCGMVEIYFDTWGHYKSKATFYVLTDKAQAVKALVGKSPMVSTPQAGNSPMVDKAQVGNPPITENTYKPTENTKKTNAFVTATAPVTTPAFEKPKTASGEVKTPKAKATTNPETKPQTAPAWKPAGTWERTMSEFHPKAATPLTQVQGKILRDVRSKLSALGLDADTLMRYTVQHWYSVMFNIKGGSQIAPRPEFFSSHLAEFVLYFNEHHESDAQRQAKQAARAKYLAELAQQAPEQSIAQPKKVNKFQQLIQAELAAKAAQQKASGTH